MDNSPYTSFNASDRSYFALMKKEIHAIAVGHGFSVKKAAEIDIIVAEMASNLIKYGGGGEILVRTATNDGVSTLDLLCIDNGPGMQDTQRVMADGFSSSNSLGQGLGAISRLSDLFQIYSQKDWGTILLSRLYKDEDVVPKPEIAEVRCLVVCKPGETVSGDGFGADIRAGAIRLFLGDGLGHGPEAHAAVNAAVRAFKANAKEEDPVEVIRYINGEVKKTRGLVATAATYSIKDKAWSVCGVGNIATRMVTTVATKSYMAYNGIVGLNIPTTLKSQVIPHETGQVMIMCSDGIRTRWDMSKYPGILKHDLSILAAAIYKDHSRRTDDMSVLICRLNRKA